MDPTPGLLWEPLSETQKLSDTKQTLKMKPNFGIKKKNEA